MEKKVQTYQKYAAISGSILFTVIAFLGCWELLFQGKVSNRFPLWCFPLLEGMYFLLAGEVFRRKLSIRRFALFLWMNGVGYPLCWILLLFWKPFLLSGFIILIFLIPMTVFLALTWLCLAAVMIGIRTVVRKLKK